MVRRFLKNLIVTSGISLLILYLFYLFVLPVLVSSDFFVNRLEKFLYGNKQIVLNIDNLELKTHWDFSFDLSSSKVLLKDSSKIDVIVVDNVNSKFKSFRLSNLNVDYIYADAIKVKDFFSSKNENKKSNFHLKYVPFVNIKELNVNAYKSELDNFSIKGSNFIIYQNEDAIVCNSDLTLSSPYLNKPVIIGNSGYLSYKNSELFAEKLSVSFGEAELIVDGKITDSNNKSDFKISGNDIPIHDLQISLLYFQKLKKKGKVFIENFYDFSGIVDVDLTYSDNGLQGTCKTKNLAAKSVLYNVPIYFDNALFNFKNNSVWSEAYGKLGNEKVYTYFITSDLFTKNLKTKGHVKSILSNEFVSEYLNDVKIVGKADTSVDYTVKNGQIDVSYLVKLNSGSDLYYQNANLGLYAFDRRLFVKTHKDGDKLSITHYDYSLRDGSEITNIILGDGLFAKENGKQVLQYLTLKTNGYAPVSVTGSFGEYVDGGMFSGDLKYDNKKKIIIGDFIIVDSNYKDVHLEKAIINADEKIMNISANGTYDDSPYNCVITAKNDFNEKIHIYDMDLFLDEFVVRKGDYKVKNKRLTPFENKKDIDIDIDNWKIKLNKITHKRILLEHILLSGSLKDDVFKFIMSDVSFAKGLLNANGWYNFNNHSSCIDFSADKVDSNVFADTVLGLPNQISGLASAKLHADTKNKLKDIKATVEFTVDDGYLPTLGSTEFLINKSSKNKRPLKIKLSDIINIDISKSKALASDLKGYFEVDNEKMSNINITSQQKYLSLLIEGDYNIDSQNADLKLWGKYNKKAQRGVKILFVPLSFIVKIVFRPEHTKQLYQNKLDKVPPIVSEPQDEQDFRVKLKGNINTNNVQVELKSII